MAAITQLLVPNKKCIINADLDGVISGLVLHNVLGWDVVGFSMCNGAPTDNIWIRNGHRITECVFIDLPLAESGIYCIDQHFNTITQGNAELQLQNQYIANPNMQRGRYFLSADGGYTSKYPFGTVHYIIAGLEISDYEVPLSLSNSISGVTSYDILLRADRIVGNSARYAGNCRKWADWLAQPYCPISQKIHNTVYNVDSRSLAAEHEVEALMRQLGCQRGDGDCSNMLRENNFAALRNFINKIAELFGVDPFQVDETYNAQNNLTGYRKTISLQSAESVVSNELAYNQIFSYAIVNMREISFTKKQ